MDVVPAALISGLVSIGVYSACRFLPEAADFRQEVNIYPIGQAVTVLEIDQDPNGRLLQGRVRVSGETWRARLNTPPLRVGDSVRVIGGDGITLICAPLDVEAMEPVSVPDMRVPRLSSGFGRTIAALLCVILMSLATLPLTALPIAPGLALFGLFAPFAVVIALIAIGPSRGAGLTVRNLRAVIAATCGLVILLALTCDLAAALGPAISALVLAAFDPSLSVILVALGGGPTPT